MEIDAHAVAGQTGLEAAGERTRLVHCRPQTLGWLGAEVVPDDSEAGFHRVAAGGRVAVAVGEDANRSRRGEDLAVREAHRFDLLLLRVSEGREADLAHEDVGR